MYLFPGAEGDMLKTLNRKLLFGVVGTLAASALLVYGLHRWQVRRLGDRLRGEAVAAGEGGNYERAAPLLQQYLTLRPNDVQALVLYGRSLEHLPDPERNRPQALTAYEKALALDASRGDVRLRLVHLRLAQGETLAARRHLDVLLKGMPDEDSFVRVGVGPWYQPNRRFVALAPNAELGQLQLLRARCLEAENRFDEAEKAYELAVLHEPQSTDAYVGLAAVRRRLGKRTQADAALVDLIDANPTSADAYLRRALLRMSDGQLSEAREDLTTAARLDPDNVRVARADADLACRLGDLGEARRRWQETVRRHPEDVGAFVGLAAVEIERGDADAALDSVRRGLERHPNHPDLRHMEVEALLLKKDEAAAEKVLTNLGERTPAGLVGYLTARLEMVRGHWIEAARRLEDVLATFGLAPDLECRACFNAGLCHARLGNTDRQVAYFYRAVELEPDLVPARLGLVPPCRSWAVPMRRWHACVRWRGCRCRRTVSGYRCALALMQSNLALPESRRDEAEVRRTWAEADEALRLRRRVRRLGDPGRRRPGPRRLAGRPGPARHRGPRRPVRRPHPAARPPRTPAGRGPLDAL